MNYLNLNTFFKLLTTNFSSRFLCFFSIFILLFLSACTEQPKQLDKSSHGIEIEGAWARATFAMAKTGAAYFTLNNHSEHSIQLISAKVKSSVAMTAELHNTVMQNGMMQMQELEEGVVVAKGGSVSFEPGGKHIMLMGLMEPLVSGEVLQITLTFADGLQIEQEFQILDKR